MRLTVASHPGQVFSGLVTWINPGIDAESRTFQAEVAVPNDDRILRPGGFVKASVVTSAGSERTIVPVEAIVQFAGVTKLFVVNGDKARAVGVETGTEGPGWIEVRGDVPADAQVVVTGQTQLADGTAIVIRQATPETTEGPAAEAARAAPAERENKPSDVTAG